MLSLKPINDWLVGKQRLLLVTHKNPDGDALGSLFGCYHLLSQMMRVCHVHLAEEPPVLYKGIQALSIPSNRIFIGKQTDVSSYDGVIVLDAARKDMPTIAGLIDFCTTKNIPTLCIDHHADNENYAQLTVMLKEYAATAAILTDTALQFAWEVNPMAATALLLGIIRDTGGFRFQNTDARTLRLSAFLIDKGGMYDDLIKRIFFSEKIEKLRFTSHVINNELTFAANGRILMVKLPNELFDRFGLHKRDMEGLIDTLRTIEGVIITCVFTEFNEEIKLSLRSSNEQYSVQEIAHQLNGGGHVLASGARVPGTSFKLAEQQFLKLAEAMF